jgi:putative spermidine/putrescine transport system permease protein
MAVFMLLFVGPLAMLVAESFAKHDPGRITAVPGSFTLDHYADLFQKGYLGYFLDTFRLSLIATIVGVAIGYVAAFVLARMRAGRLRLYCVVSLVSLLFLSVIVRVYALALTLRPSGLIRPVVQYFGIAGNDSFLLEGSVIAGLVHYIMPISALTLMGTIQSIDPKLCEAAESLGAPRWRAFLEITVPLSVHGIVSALLLGYAISISSFVVPMVLGRGMVLFATNLTYQNFVEVPNFPGGAAVAVVLLIASLLPIYIALRFVSGRIAVT